MLAFIITILLLPALLKITKRTIGLTKKSIDALFDKIEKKL